MAWNFKAMQRRIDNFRHWYNDVRCHAALSGRTPEEVWAGVELPEPIPIRQADSIGVMARVTRRAFGGDRRLPVIDVDVGVFSRKAA